MGLRPGGASYQTVGSELRAFVAEGGAMFPRPVVSSGLACFQATRVPQRWGEGPRRILEKSTFGKLHFWKFAFWKSGFLEIHFCKTGFWKNPSFEKWIFSDLGPAAGRADGRAELEPEPARAEPRVFSTRLSLQSLFLFFSLSPSLSHWSLVFLFAIVLKGGRELTAANLSG